MGIKNLHPFLRKACPVVYKEVHLSSFAYKKIAVDVSIYMCRFKTTFGKNWLEGFLLLCMLFRENEVHPVFVYDTKFPPEKDEEKKLRAISRLKTKERTEKLVADWEEYKKDLPGVSAVSPDMPDFLRDFLVKTFPGKQDISIGEVDREMSRLLYTLLKISASDYELTKQLFTLLGVSWLDAPGEAEAACAVLCRKGFVDGVLSEDTDVLNYRSSVFLHRLNLSQNSLVEIRFHDVLQHLDLNTQQFLDFCIMCGTDYNSNLPKIGPEKAYKLIKKYGSLEQIQLHNPNIDVSSLPYKRVREIFLDEQEIKEEHLEKIQFAGFPDLPKLTEFCFHQNCRVDLDRLKKAFFENPNIAFLHS